MTDYQKIIDEYSTDYCDFLEAAYGEHMMSEGGTAAIEQMFSGVTLTGKALLDVGCGLGGVAFYLAKQHQANVTGLELNADMAAEAQRRIPAELSHLLNFVSYETVPTLPFADAQFDIVFSKGVLTHIQDKLPLFKEIRRVLTTDGKLIIDDWLSPHKDQWGPNIQKMCDAEDLTLYAETEAAYQQVLEQAGFTNINIIDRNHDYASYNRDIVKHLQQKKSSFIENFDTESFQLAVESYSLIAEAIENHELLIRGIYASLK